MVELPWLGFAHFSPFHTFEGEKKNHSTSIVFQHINFISPVGDTYRMVCLQRWRRRRRRVRRET